MEPLTLFANPCLIKIHNNKVNSQMKSRKFWKAHLKDYRAHSGTKLLPTLRSFFHEHLATRRKLK